MPWQLATSLSKSQPNPSPANTVADCSFPFAPQEAVHCALHAPRPARRPVLYLTNKLRRRPDSGGAKREHEILCRLHERFDLHYVACTPAFEEERAIVCAPPLPFISVTILRTGKLLPPPADAALPERMRDHASPIGQKVVDWLLRQYQPQLIHCEGYFLMQHLPSQTPPPVVLLEENVEFELDRDRARVSGWDQDIALASRVAERIETACWKRAHACVAVTSEDAQIIQAKAPASRVSSLPNGGTAASQPLLNADSRQALYVANYNWAPSRDACLHLLDQLWPRIVATNSRAKLLLAGAGMDPELRRRALDAKNVEIESPYDTFAEIAQRSAVFISPLRFGGGHKMKIVEALCAGLPIVATPLSLRGFSSEARQAAITTQDLNEFATFTAKLLANPDACRQMGEASLDAARRLPGWDSVANGLADVWTTTLAVAASDPIAPLARAESRESPSVHPRT
jgi:glycosyltransferase involved in cell wall biosynthesis